MIVKEGDGIYVIDIDNKRYIDGVSSLSNVNIGYGKKELANASLNQLKKLSHSPLKQSFSHTPAILLSAKIATLTPKGLNRVIFTTGETESYHIACQMAKRYWEIQGDTNEKKLILTSKSEEGIHASQDKNIDFLYVKAHCIQSLHSIMDNKGADSIAAIVIEPILYNEGIQIPSHDYFQQVEKICHEEKILLIVDETHTGFGQTGKLFACEHWGMSPDLLLLSNGLTSGYFPLGAVGMSDRISQAYKDHYKGEIPLTEAFSGHPVACAIAMQNIDTIMKEKLAEHASHMGKLLTKKLNKLKEKYPVIQSIRCIGLLCAIDFKSEYSYPLAYRIRDIAQNLGLIIEAITCKNQDTIVIAPPLIINNKELTVLIRILDEAIHSA